MRANGLHHLSASITKRFHTIGIEDLHVKGMLANGCLSRAIADMGFAELRRQLAYKAQRRAGQVVVIDRWYPSSQRVQPVFKIRNEPLIGGGLTSVAFQRSGYTYTVYSRVGRAPDGVTPEFDDGLTVERRGKTLRHARCDDGGAGFLEPPLALVK